MNQTAEPISGDEGSMVRSVVSLGLGAAGLTIASINPVEIVHLLIGLLLAVAGVFTSLPKGVDGLVKLDKWWAGRQRRARRKSKLRKRIKTIVPAPMEEESEL